MKTSASIAGTIASLIVAWSAAAAEPVVADLWPGRPPDEQGGIRPERVRMSPKLDRKQVEVTEPTRMITGVANPTITICRPSTGKNTGTAVLICPGGGYWDLYWQLEGEEVAAWLNSIRASSFRPARLRSFLCTAGTTSSVRRRTACSCISLLSEQVFPLSGTSMQGPPTISVSARAAVRAPPGPSLARIGCATALSFRSTRRISFGLNSEFKVQLSSAHDTADSLDERRHCQRCSNSVEAGETVFQRLANHPPRSATPACSIRCKSFSTTVLPILTRAGGAQGVPFPPTGTF